MAKIIKGKKFNVLSKVKDAYTHVHKEDSLGEYLNPKITFVELLAAIKNGKDFYDLIGVSDSVIRERVFVQMALLFGLKYDDIYEIWLNNE